SSYYDEEDVVTYKSNISIKSKESESTTPQRSPRGIETPPISESTTPQKSSRREQLPEKREKQETSKRQYLRSTSMRSLPTQKRQMDLKGGIQSRRRSLSIDKPIVNTPSDPSNQMRRASMVIQRSNVKTTPQFAKSFSVKKNPMSKSFAFDPRRQSLPSFGLQGMR